MASIYARPSTTEATYAAPVGPAIVKISEPLNTPVIVSADVPRRTIVRRDSLERREALLKGKEGSRQRRRWENGENSPMLH